MTNIAEILKDCQSGTKLYSPICGECELLEITNRYAFAIRVKAVKSKRIFIFSADGRFMDDGNEGECLLFPSKENRDWSAFNNTKRFKKGDFVYVSSTASTEIFIFKEINEKGFVQCFCTYDSEDGFIGGSYHFIGKLNEFFRLATEEEKQKLLKAIDEKGYIWDSEKLEFIKKEPEFKQFDKVLVRDFDDSKWIPALYGFKVEIPSPIHIVAGGGKWKQCIPYEGNEHLLGTTKNCE